MTIVSKDSHVNHYPRSLVHRYIFSNDSHTTNDSITNQKEVLRPNEHGVFRVKCTKSVRLTPANYHRNVFHLEFDISGTGLTCVNPHTPAIALLHSCSNSHQKKVRLASLCVVVRCIAVGLMHACLSAVPTTAVLSAM
jgi:hypothetical protein